MVAADSEGGSSALRILHLADLATPTNRWIRHDDEDIGAGRENINKGSELGVADLHGLEL